MEGLYDDLLESAFHKGDLGQAAYRHRGPERLSVSFIWWNRTSERATWGFKIDIDIFDSALTRIDGCNKCN